MAAATGAEFDRRFLELDDLPPEDALVMVDDLFAAGGGQQPEIFQLPTHIAADQRVEIDPDAADAGRAAGRPSRAASGT